MEQRTIACNSEESVRWITECIGIVMGKKGSGSKWGSQDSAGQGCVQREHAHVFFARVRFCASVHPCTPTGKTTEQTE